MGADLPCKKILIVDDAPRVMQTLVLVLRGAGFHAAGQTSASAALEAAQAQRPDILLCDIQLGDRNGVELSLDIAKFLPDCRFILMSGDTTSTKILADAHHRGHDFEVMAKPMPPDEMLALLGPASSPLKARGVTVSDLNTTERRGQQRVHFDSPASVTVGHHAIAAFTKDVNERGIFFLTDARLELGSETVTTVMLPEEAGLPLSGMVRCHGHVVRSVFVGGQYGVAVEIDRIAPVQQL